jgi:hypothetical protein
MIRTNGLIAVLRIAFIVITPLVERRHAVASRDRGEVDFGVGSRHPRREAKAAF